MGTHYVTRELLAIGHDVRQVPPVYAKPFRQTHKNDFRDAHATAEAVQRPTTRCVPAKTDEQLDLQALHRVRYRLVGQRTAVINQIRSFLLEHGITVRQRLHWLRHALPDISLRLRSRAPRSLATRRRSMNAPATWRIILQPRSSLLVRSSPDAVRSLTPRFASRAMPSSCTTRSRQNGWHPRQ
jgi:transposase